MYIIPPSFIQIHLPMSKIMHVLVASRGVAIVPLSQFLDSEQNQLPIFP